MRIAAARRMRRRIYRAGGVTVSLGEGCNAEDTEGKRYSSSMTESYLALRLKERSMSFLILTLVGGERHSLEEISR